MSAAHVFTLESLSARGTDRAQFEEWAEGWVDRLDDGYTYDDLLDRLDRSVWIEADGSRTTVDLPGQLDDPVYVRLRGILRRIRQETRA